MRLDRISSARAKKACDETRAMFCQHNYQIIHAHDVLYGKAVLNHGLPVVLTVHGPMSREARMLKMGGKSFYSYLVEQERAAYEGADQIITVDSGQKEVIINDYNINPSKINVILNAVNVPSIKTSMKQTEINKPYFLVPRRLVPKNGISVAIEAFKLFSSNSYELWITGDGPEYQNLRNLAKKLGISARVKFLGTVEHEHMLCLMAESKAVIIPSVPVEGVVEASSISALEAMSLSKPVIASKIGGLQEIIQDGCNGLLFEAGDSYGLKLQMEKLTDEKKGQEIGRCALNYVAKNHSTTEWLNKILDVYKKVLTEI